ncbi:MAG TPA: CocE/NonD family hydrolase [Candidatus Thermoplasmatota archaeon]
MRPLLALLLATAFVVSGCVGSPTESQEQREAKQIQAATNAAPVFPGVYKFDGRASEVLAPGLLSILPMEEVYLSSDLDGVDIQMAIWRPDTGASVPAIIQASPYFSDAKNLETRVGQFSLDNFVPHGYAYIQLPVRSTGNSGGCDDFRGPDMVADMSQAIDWIAEQPWSNGNVALMGISYVGTTPWYAAGSGNPHIKTIVPVSGSTNAWEVYNRNGSSEGRSPTIIPGYGSSAASNAQRTPEHKVENFTCTSGDVYQAWAAGIYAGITGDKDPFRQFWDERNVKPFVEANYKGSIFVVHGFEDWNVDPAVVFPWTRELNMTYGLEVKTLIGQWPHTFPDLGAPAMKRWDYAEILLHWFDKYLKGIETETGPWAQIQDNQMRWRNEDYYPPIDADWTKLHLTTGGQLAAEPGAAGSVRLVPAEVMVEQARQAPAPIDFFEDFTWGPFDEEVLISGLPRVHVTVAPDGPGGYMGAHLYSRDPTSGDEVRIGWTSMNLRYHEGGDTPVVVTPGEPIVAKMEIQPMDAVVPAGHQLLLRVWVNTHADRTPSLPPTVVDLQWGGSTQSFVELPIIERDASAYFQPPMPPEEPAS